MGILKESGATPLTQRRNGSTALSQHVMIHTDIHSHANKAVHWVQTTLELKASLKMGKRAKPGQP